MTIRLHDEFAIKTYASICLILCCVISAHPAAAANSGAAPSHKAASDEVVSGIPDRAGVLVIAQQITPPPVAPNSTRTSQQLVFAEQIAAADWCAQINSAIASLPAGGGLVYYMGSSPVACTSGPVRIGTETQQVSVILGSANFVGSVDPLFIVDRGSHLELMPGTVVRQTCKTCNAIVLAGRGFQWLNGGIFGSGGKILGPGSDTATTGIVVGGTKDAGNRPNNGANRTTIYGVQIAGFGQGIRLGNNVWSWTLSEAMVGASDREEANGIGIEIPPRLIEEGEDMAISNSNISGNINQGLDIRNQSEFNVSGTAFDNNGNGTSKSQISLAATNVHFSCAGCHFEENIGGPQRRSFIEMHDSEATISGGMFTTGVPVDGSMILATGKSYVYVYGVLFGAAEGKTVANALTLANESQAMFLPASVSVFYQHAINNVGKGSTLAFGGRPGEITGLRSPVPLSPGDGSNPYRLVLKNPDAPRDLTISDPGPNANFTFSTERTILAGPTSTIGAGRCATASGRLPGVNADMSLMATPSGDPAGANYNNLSVYIFATTNAAHLEVCNHSSEAVTPGPLDFVVRGLQ
jgi:hypothetical protein